MIQCIDMGLLAADANEMIPVSRLMFALIPVAVVLVILQRWSISAWNSVYAVTRMLVQLLILGYVLTHIFDSDSPPVVMAVLAVMIVVAGCISLRVSPQNRRRLLPKALLAIFVGGTGTLFVVTQLVLDLDPWYQPNKMIPLAGMIYSNCMNAVSLAVERFLSDTSDGTSVVEARAAALRASLIPITNSLFAVGLVAIPGMMTGQILKGEDASAAARYQIVVMCMMFGSAGMASAFALRLIHGAPAVDAESPDVLKEAE